MESSEKPGSTALAARSRCVLLIKSSTKLQDMRGGRTGGEDILSNRRGLLLLDELANSLSNAIFRDDVHGLFGPREEVVDEVIDADGVKVVHSREVGQHLPVVALPFGCEVRRGRVGRDLQTLPFFGRSRACPTDLQRGRRISAQSDLERCWDSHCTQRGDEGGGGAWKDHLETLGGASGRSFR